MGACANEENPTFLMNHLETGDPKGAPPQRSDNSGFDTLPDQEPIEEERWPWYTPQSFYPVSIGAVFCSRYKVLYKLGYGTTSTIWMGRDLRLNKYICIKSMVSDYSSTQRELGAYDILSRTSPTSRTLPEWKSSIRHALDRFELSHEDRVYHFLIHEPLGVTQELYFAVIEGQKLEFHLAQELAVQMLCALQYLHAAAKIVHADLQAKNVLLTINDPSIIEEMEEAERNQPSPRKITREGTTIFSTRDFPEEALSRFIGKNSRLVLCDFGEARYGQTEYTDFIQPAEYRAPEVFLGVPWSTEVDIWNLGCLTWHCMFDNHLFPRTTGEDPTTADADQMATMVALLGPPPKHLLTANSEKALMLFDQEGLPRGKVPSCTFESLLEENLIRVEMTLTEEEKQLFLKFIRRTLTWTKETRASALDLLQDPWVVYPWGLGATE